LVAIKSFVTIYLQSLCKVDKKLLISRLFLEVIYSINTWVSARSSSVLGLYFVIGVRHNARTVIEISKTVKIVINIVRINFTIIVMH